MIAFKVKLNGKRVCIAGAEDLTILTTSVHASGKLGKKTVPAWPDDTEGEVFYSVGGLTGRPDPDKDVHLLWISDIGLPDGSGLDIMRHFRHRAAGGGDVGERPPVRGIALSGFGMEEDIRRSREAGFEHHLTKPVTFDRLRAVLKQIEAAGR
jgi:CheY-like chemotaxis protein